MSDKDGRNPSFPEPEQAEPLPLSPRKVRVARFSRRVMIAAISVIAGVTALSMIVALSPRKKATPQEKAAQQSPQSQANADQPELPECLAGAPKGYGEARKGDAPYGTPANGAPALGPPLEPGHASLAYVSHPVQGQNPEGATLTPQQQAVLAREELRRKEALEARRSGLTFNGAKSGAPQPATVVGAGQPHNGLPSLDRLEGLAGRLGLGQIPGGEEAMPDQNRQDEKKQFVSERRSDSPYLGNLLLKPLSPYEIKAGTILPGTLITGINSDLPGQIVAQLRENVYDTVTGRHLLLPQGTRLIGEYDSSISYGQERVLVIWSRLILPSGNSISLEGMPGVDLSGYAGAAGRVNNHYDKLITGVILGSVIGAGSQVAVGGQGSPNTPPSFGQLATSGAAQNINRAGQQITEKNLNLQPTIEVPPGLKINIFLTKDMILRPVKE